MGQHGIYPVKSRLPAANASPKNPWIADRLKASADAPKYRLQKKIHALELVAVTDKTTIYSGFIFQGRSGPCPHQEPYRAIF
ncbi:MAG: hypothetical protein K2P67_03330 [Gallionellaceae bacterium]|jgi:hypothetical protein|nr:hypothetical protein [Gallionellaceae bacterium]